MTPYEEKYNDLREKGYPAYEAAVAANEYALFVSQRQAEYDAEWPTYEMPEL